MLPELNSGRISQKGRGELGVKQGRGARVLRHRYSRGVAIFDGASSRLYESSGGKQVDGLPPAPFIVEPKRKLFDLPRVAHVIR